MFFGGFEAQRIFSWEWDCVGAVAILTRCPPEILWISDGWRPLCKIANSVWSLK
jgi:hypothetical protein